MARYSNRVLHEFADELLQQADYMMLLVGGLGLLVGTIAGFVFSGGGTDARMMMGIGAGAGALIGAAIGRRRAFVLRIQAHSMLCQVEIEEHLRKVAGVTAEPEKIGFGGAGRTPRLAPRE